MSSPRFLFINGVVSPCSDTPPVSTFLETHPGAYTTSRTHNDGSHLLFWEKHLHRLADSARILFNSNPKLLFKHEKVMVPISIQREKSWAWDSMVQSIVNDSMEKALPVALKEMRNDRELAITALLSGNLEKLSQDEIVNEEDILRVFNVYIHVGVYAPLVFGVGEKGAHLAVVGRGRDVANAKYSDWVRLRKPLEKLRPPLATELLLSNDGDQILEGCITNFFVVFLKDNIDDVSGSMEEDLHDGRSTYPVELQTAPISDGVLPGVVRQVVIEVCLRNGIPLREVAPSWSKREFWKEAFITNGLRLLQHVETIQAPNSWDSLESRTWKEVTWEEKQFEEGPGSITAVIQKEVMKRAGLEAFPVTSFNGKRKVGPSVG